MYFTRSAKLCNKKAKKTILTKYYAYSGGLLKVCVQVLLGWGLSHGSDKGQGSVNLSTCNMFALLRQRNKGRRRG
jgi:hypothetical protein